MNALAIIALLLLMNYSKQNIQQTVEFSENKLLQIKQVFLKNFNYYLKEKKHASNISIQKSVIGIKNSKQIFIHLNYSFVNTTNKTSIYKKAKVTIESTANAHEWLVKKVINNTEEVQFQEAFIINL